MKLQARVILSTFFAFAFLGISFAQNVMPFGMEGKVILLTQKSIKKEIHLTPAQEKKIQAMMKGLESNQAGFGIPDMHYMTREIDARLVDCLEPEQLKRLHEIFLQANGLVALSEKSVIDALNLSPEQIQQSKSIIKAFDKESMAKLMETQKTKKIDNKALEQLRQKANEDLTAVLNAEQQDQWKILLGTPFKFQK